MEPEEKIHVLTQDLCKDLTSTLSRARSGCEANPSEWVEKRISGELGPSIGRYARYFSELGISSHGELTELFKTHYKSRNVREVYEDLQEVEEEWNQFMVHVDTKLTSAKSHVLQEGQHVPHSLQIQTIRSEELALKDLYGEKEYLHLILLRHFA